MKTQKKSSQRLYLQTKSNRWKWMAGATAATAAGVTASQASAITINLVNNYISGLDNHLNADLTGDGHPDLTIANIVGGSYDYAGVTLNGTRAICRYAAGSFIFNGRMKLGLRSASFHSQRLTYPYTHFGTYSLMGSIPIFFKDLHINGGAPTRGSLEVTVTPREIELDSFTYASNTPVKGSIGSVPDQGSSLALLAMGAGGILAFRRWRAAQGRP